MKRLVSLLVCVCCVGLFLDSGVLQSQDAKTEVKKADEPEFAGSVTVIYARGGKITLYATPGLEVPVPDGVEATARLFSDGTTVTLEARAVTVKRVKKYTPEFKKKVEIKYEKEELVIQISTAVRLSLEHR